MSICLQQSQGVCLATDVRGLCLYSTLSHSDLLDEKKKLEDRLKAAQANGDIYSLPVISQKLACLDRYLLLTQVTHPTSSSTTAL